MHYLALGLALLGLFILNASFFASPQDLDDSLVSGRFVHYSGLVSSERVITPSFRLLTVGNQSVVCSCSRSYLNASIELFGITSVYDNEPQIRALSIRPFP